MREKGPTISYKRKPRPSPAEWAKTNPRRRGNPCWICSRPEARKAVEEFLALPEPPSHRAVASYLAEYFGCPLRPVSVSQCIRTHVLAVRA